VEDKIVKKGRRKRSGDQSSVCSDRSELCACVGEGEKMAKCVMSNNPD
jgi:hypothetical protein